MGEVNVGIVGLTGYVGSELIKLIGGHPCLMLVAGFVTNESGHQDESIVMDDQKRTVPLYPISDIVEFEKKIDILLLATPAHTSIYIIDMVKPLKMKVIDLSGALRLSQNDCEKWYGIKHAMTPFKHGAHYGLSPWNATGSRTQSVIANPGCYATATLMALVPLLKHHVIKSNNIIIDAKSGTSGAGKKPKKKFTRKEMVGNFFPYKIGLHQHVPEINQALKKILKKSCEFILTTQMIPVERGMALSIYADLDLSHVDQDKANDAVYDAFKMSYEDYPLVKVHKTSSHQDINDCEDIELKSVVNKPMTHIHYFIDHQKIIIFVLIDNLLKGAASQAIENLNSMYGFPVYMGLINEEVMQ